MGDLIESIKSNPIAYYVGFLMGVAILALLIYLIIRNDKKKKDSVIEKEEEKARIERHVDLEAMIAQMQEQEQNKLKDVDPVANFEQEQEEKAIISYKELVDAVKSNNNTNNESINVINVSSDGNVLSTTDIPKRPIVSDDKPVFIDEVNMPKSEFEFDPREDVVVQHSTVDQNKVVSNPVKVEEPTLINNSEKLFPHIEETSQYKEFKKKENIKFKNSEFISPIYGRLNNNVTYPTISSTKDNDEEVINISSDVDPNDEFLRTLKTFRNE